VALPGAGARARFPALGPDAEVILWNGGVWNWMDPVTAVRAVGRLAPERPRARLVFMGRPPPDPAEAAAATAARDVAGQLGLLDRVVFFNDAWVPYEERGAWLLDAACAVSAHPDDVETRYSFRTRVLDCFRAGLPVVCTAGDELSERVAREELGAVCPPGDAEAMAGALAQVLDRGRGAYAGALARAAAGHRWDRVAAPLVRHVTHPAAPSLGSPATRHLARPLQRARALATRALRRAALLRR
jgi:glycosyltransferase involved in cell wall biosynthesis